MEQLVFVPLLLVVVVALAWAWWASRPAANPRSSVDNFHKALSAMSPAERRAAERETEDA